eukprot:FR740932.1.p3 GENE.FR740932.1~~FR740932.1.p3  ORF type:complete len:118 (+),score=17.59 FR740932.1:416-769(+)
MTHKNVKFMPLLSPAPTGATGGATTTATAREAIKQGLKCPLNPHTAPLEQGLHLLCFKFARDDKRRPPLTQVRVWIHPRPRGVGRKTKRNDARRLYHPGQGTQGERDRSGGPCLKTF